MSPASGGTDARGYPADGGLTASSVIIATKWSSPLPPGPGCLLETPPGPRPHAGGACALGLHVGASFDRIFDLEHCFLQSPQSPAIVPEVRRWCGHSGLAAYNTEHPSGLLAISGAAGGQAHRPDPGAPHHHRPGRPGRGGGTGRPSEGPLSGHHHPGAFPQPTKGPGGQSASPAAPCGDRDILKSSSAICACGSRPILSCKPIPRPPKVCITPSAGWESSPARRPSGISTAAPAASPSPGLSSAPGGGI